MLINRARQWVVLVLLLLAIPAAGAQTRFALNGNGWMGMGTRNGDFFIVQDDLQVKVPGGYARINRDYDGRQWVFNRQWSGLGRPSYNKAMYPSIGAFYSCTIVDGVSSCDTTASAGSAMLMGGFEDVVQQTRVPNDPYFGRDIEGRPAPDPYADQFVARMGVGFTRSSDGTSWVSSKHPRFILRPQPVPVLPPSAGPDAHPAAGKPGHGGIATTQVNGFRWTERSGDWIEYDNLGRITSYGDRNDVRVWMQYGSHGQIERVLDDNGRTVFTLLYSSGSADFISQVRDHTPVDGSIRRVQYHYDGDGRLRSVIDARGHSTAFDYGTQSAEAYDYNLGSGIGSGGSGGSGTGAGLLVVDTRRKVTKVTDAEGRVTAIAYGVTARVGRILAPDGGATDFEYGYDKLKKEFSVTTRHPQTAAGRKVETRRYDQEGRVVSLEVNGKVVSTSQGSRQSMGYVDERGGTIRVDRDNFDLVTRQVNADGTWVSISYDSASTDPREIVDEAGVATRLEYDDKGNLLKLTAAAGKPEEQVTEYVPNAQGLPDRVRRKGGANPTGTTDPDVDVGLSYDANGNVREMVDGEGKAWKYEYDAMGNLLKATDPLGHAWTYEYDAHGNRTVSTDPNQLATRYSYDRTGRLVTVTDSRAKVYQFRYDPVGRPWQMQDPTGAIVSLEYDKAGRIVTSSDVMNQRLSLAWDNHDRVVSMTDGEGNVTALDYTGADGQDRGGALVAKVAYPTLQHLIEYNSRQQVTQLAEVVDGQARVTTAAYEPRGARRAVVNPYGKEVATDYDALGRLKTTRDELGHLVQLGYDRRSNLVSVTDERGHVTRLEYDGRNKLVRETNAEGQATDYVYDDAGRVSEIRRPNGYKLGFVFDAAGRLQQRKSYRPDGSVELTDEFDWDTGGRLQGWSTGSASSVLSYDDANRLLRESVTVDGVTLTRAYTYYANGQVRTYTGPDGATITYAYDGGGELERVDLPGQGSITVAERTWTEPRKVLLPGGTTKEYTRNGDLRPTQLRVRSPSQSQLLEQGGEYGKLGELLSRTTQGRRVDYRYDDAIRLKQADPSGLGASETFELDPADNRTADATTAGPWEYDDANRLLRRGAVEYRYDAAGNLIQKIDAGLAEPLRTTRYAYDGYNRLVEVRDGADEVVSRYAYDPFGYRISKEVTAKGAANTGAAVGKRLFLQAEEGLLAETTATGTLLQSYGWHPGQPYSTDPLFLRRGDDYFYFHNDSLGLPWMLTDKDGAVVWSISQVSAFGRVTVSAGAAFEQPWRFPGQYYDAETGLHYNVHRYYDPSIGRYVTQDPLGLNGGVNFYAYADGAPTRFVDVYGLNVGEPGLAEGFIPVWGSAREAVNDFQCGRYVWGTINTILAITDATGIGYGVKALAKGGWKVTKAAFKEWWKNTNWKKMNERLQKAGVTTRNSRSVPRNDWVETDHIWVKQRYNWPNWITNFPGNLQFNVPHWLNQDFEAMSLAERFGFLEPWRKAAVAGIGSYLLGLLPQPGKDDEEEEEGEDCDC